MRLIILLVTFLAGGSAFTQNTVKSPNDFLPHQLGEHFTPHHLLVDYFEHVAANSNRMITREYGRTNQGRPLIYNIISTPENLKNFEQIRQDHLRNIGMEKGKLKGKADKAVVWLSYGVHGNEAGASESSMAAVYALANPANKKTEAWLKNTIVILDPSINPDGYSRYTHWNRNVTNHIASPELEGREHNEPWPGGRVNHYLFDLNRDWAWQTQVESQQRIKIYHEWMPHIHVDFHEMGHNEPYFFAPAAQPFHDYITPWQSEFQFKVGTNHARYFDKNGWLYFTREVFDLFYPSYGDTWPIFHGAIGMTFEQGGHSQSSRAVQMDNGDTLRLSDRVAHHLATTLSTVEVSSENASQLIGQFKDYFSKAASSPIGEYKSFVIRGDNPAGRIKALCKLLDRNEISYGFAAKDGKYTGFSYRHQQEQSITVNKSDLVINAYQPMSVLIQVLFEPEPFLVDSLTYDITAWALPLAYGLEAYAIKNKVNVGKKFEIKTPTALKEKTKTPSYAWVKRWNSMDDARFIAALNKAGVRMRCASEAFEIEGQRYDPGTILITRADNKPLSTKIQSLLADLTKEYQQELIPVTSGFSKWGPDFGSSKMQLLDQPKVLVLSGDAVSPHSFGQVWHYFEKDLDYPLTIVDASDFSSVELSDYNLLIIPEGRYSREINSSALDNIKSWVRKGGKVIAIGRGLSAFEEKSGFSLKKYASDDEESIEKRAKERAALASRLEHYTGRERRFISNQIPGAIYKLKVDNTHPLGYGLSNYYFSLKTSTRAYKHLKDTWNVAYTEKNPKVIGFVGSNVQEKMKETTVFAVQDIGRGNVVYMVDNPLFRGFWENGKFLFSNAVFLVK